MTLNSGATLHNRYRIVKLITQGGFGTLYKAWDTTLGRSCALKENLESSPATQRQFLREAKILGNLVHPNLPRVTDYFSIPGQGQYLIMDYIEGQDLQEMLEAIGTNSPSGGRLTETQTLPWIYQICDALSYLHSQNPPVIHRDIKPANIKITQDGRATLVDFGILLGSFGLFFTLVLLFARVLPVIATTEMKMVLPGSQPKHGGGAHV